MKILILDDYGGIRNLLKESFNHYGGNSIECYTAKNYSEAVELATAHYFDIVLTDIDLCDSKSGVDFVRWLNIHQTTVKIIIYTGKSINPETYKSLKDLNYTILCEKTMSIEKAREILECYAETPKDDTGKVEFKNLRNKVDIMQLRCVEHHTDIKAIHNKFESLKDDIKDEVKTINKTMYDMKDQIYEKANLATRFSAFIGIIIAGLQIASMIYKGVVK